MLNISLSEYKNSKIYFQFFDVLLKKTDIKKEDFLLENDISPSSYRLSRKVEQNIGKSIIEKLCSLYGYTMHSDSDIEIIEKKLNSIYYDMYHKIYDNYDNYEKFIDELLEKNTILFPIIKLFKIFLFCNNQNNTNVDYVISSSSGVFEEISVFKKFFNESISEVYDIIYVIMSDINVKDYLGHTFNNGLLYFGLASKCYHKKEWLECYYFASRCREIMIKEYNFKRLIYINKHLYHCLFFFKNYNEAYELTKYELLMLKSFDPKCYEIIGAYRLHLIACLGLNKYDEIIEIVEDRVNIDLNDYCMYLVALHERNIDEYHKTIDDYKNSISEATNLEDDVLLMHDVLDDYFNNKNIKRLSSLEHVVLRWIIIILEDRKG